MKMCEGCEKDCNTCLARIEAEQIRQELLIETQAFFDEQGGQGDKSEDDEDISLPSCFCGVFYCDNEKDTCPSNCPVRTWK